MLELNQNNNQRNQDLIYLHKILYDKLYNKKIQSCNTKQEIINQSNIYITPDNKRKTTKVKYKNKYKALHDNFLYYGNKNATSFIILDIDNDKRPLETIILEVKYKLQDIKVNWILKSDNGYHIGIILNEPVYFNDTFKTEKLENIKLNLSKILNADLAGSIRKIGFWRNPLTHYSYIRNEDDPEIQEYQNLDDLYRQSNNLIFQNSGNLFNTNSENSEIQKQNNIKLQDIKQKKKIINYKINTNREHFKKGNRNNYLFLNTIGKLYNGQIKQDQIKQNLDDINQGELKETEIKSIEKSIKKYNIKPNTNKENKEGWKPGPFHKILNKENIHNYKEKNIYKNIRSQIGQVISTHKILEKNIKILVNAYTEIYKEHLPFTNKNISIKSGFSIRTIQNYRNIKNIEQDIKQAAFRKYIEEINTSNKKDVMPDFAPIDNIKNIMKKLIENIVLEYKNDLVIVFQLDKDITFRIKEPDNEQIAA